MGKRGSRPIALAVAAVLVMSACSNNVATPTPTAAPTKAPTPSATPVPTMGPATVRWFVGLGSGVLPGQVEAEKAFVANYNATNKDGITIELEVVPNAVAYDTLKTEIAAGNAPDIVGPVGVRGRNGFEGLFLDLTPEIQKQGFDLSAYDPAVVNFFKVGDQGQVGIPYEIFPGYIWYNKDAFTKAGLPPLPTTVGATYQGQTWDWNELAAVAAQLTIDKNGKNSTQTGFDPKGIVKYGMDFQWTTDPREMASFFGGGSFVAADGKTAQIPDAWAQALTWYYSGIWTGHFIPNGAAESSSLLGLGNAQASGNVAMNATWSWTIASIATDAKSAKVKNWDIAVVPSWNGTTTSPMSADTFCITRASKYPDQAFRAMTAIMADPTLIKGYGGEPARTADQAAYFKAFDAALAPIFPGNQVTWSVLSEMAKVPAIPSPETNLPALAQSQNDFEAFFTRLQNTAGLDVKAEMAKLQTTLQTDFNNAQPLVSP